MYSQYLDVIMNGKLLKEDLEYYNNIQCDRCYRNNLTMYISYRETDLCLNCVDLINNLCNKNINPNNLTRMEQDIFIPNILIDNQCIEHNPCKHHLIIDGYKDKLISGPEIVQKYWNYLNDTQKNHFKKYQK